MGFYELVWLISLGLAGLSICVMMVLVIHRAISDALARRAEAQRNRMTIWLLDYLEAASPGMASDFIESKQDAKVLIKVVEHLLRSVSGEEGERLIAVLRSLGSVEILLKQLRAGEEWQRIGAAHSLRFLEGPGVLEALNLALDDPSAGVRSTAARALREQMALPSVRTLIDKLVIEAEVPPQALRDIFRGLGTAFNGELIAALRSENENARIVAVDALGHSGDLYIVEPLLELLDGASMEIATNIYRALALLGDPRALPAVLRGLRSAAWEVRCQAALCAGKIGAIEAVPILTALLGDPVWWVRYRAAEALFDLGEQGICVLALESEQATDAGETAQLVLAEKRTAA